MKKYAYITLGIATVFLSSCTKTQFDDYETHSGTANFANYVAVGNSLTQGIQDAGLHNEHSQQLNTYPAMLARQMKLASPGLNFVQPIVSGTGQSYKQLEWIDGEIEVTDASASPSWNNWNTSVKYNNLGISGIRLTDCVPDASPFSSTINQVICSINPNGAFLDFGTIFTNEISYIDHVRASGATFFTNWLGNNDVLGWATNGGEDNDTTILSINFAFTGMTDPVIFRNKYDSILDAFQAMGAKGVCASIPDVTSIPFFTTVTLDAVGDDVWITEGPYSSNPGNVRLATPDDLLTLYASEDLGDGIGFTQANPIPHGNVLDRDEVIVSQTRTMELNNHIHASAAAHGYPVADMFAYMKELESGITFDGVDYTAKFIEGGAFSIDGIHPNTRGYAIVANKFIEVINQNYGSNLQPVVVADYPGIIFPH